MKVVELHQAFSYTCDNCGMHNFVSPVMLEREQLEHLDDTGESGRIMERFGAFLQDMDEQFDGIEGGVMFTLAPKIVECKECGEEYMTREAWEDEDE